MKTETEWNQDIINITMKIHQEVPELSKYIKEVPVKITEEHNVGVNIKNLEEYYNSLVALIERYLKTHAGINVKNDMSGND